MRIMKRLLGAAVLAAGLTTMVVAPTAGATPSDTPNGTAVTHLGGLILRPAHLTKPKQAGTMSAQATTDVTAYLIGPVSDPNRCLDADLNTIGANGTKVQLWDCNNTSANQAWIITQIPEGYYRFQNVYSGRYLDADLNTIGRNGTKIQLWDYRAGARNQWFGAAAVNGQPDYTRFQSASSGRYLDADTNTANRNGTIVQLWDFLPAHPNQWWY